jgi:hypothetical protein
MRMNVQNKAFLAVSLALSCGVMVYVSMVEIFVKSLGALRYHAPLLLPRRGIAQSCRCNQTGLPERERAF